MRFGAIILSVPFFRCQYSNPESSVNRLNNIIGTKWFRLGVFTIFCLEYSVLRIENANLDKSRISERFTILTSSVTHPANISSGCRTMYEFFEVLLSFNGLYFNWVSIHVLIGSSIRSIKPVSTMNSFISTVAGSYPKQKYQKP